MKTFISTLNVGLARLGVQTLCCKMGERGATVCLVEVTVEVTCDMGTWTERRLKTFHPSCLWLISTFPNIIIISVFYVVPPDLPLPIPHVQCRYNTRLFQIDTTYSTSTHTHTLTPTYMESAEEFINYIRTICSYLLTFTSMQYIHASFPSPKSSSFCIFRKVMAGEKDKKIFPKHFYSLLSALKILKTYIHIRHGFIFIRLCFFVVPSSFHTSEKRTLPNMPE